MIALSTGSLYTYGTARVFDLAARAGFDGVEVLVDHRWDTRQADYVRSLVDAYGLPIVALHSPFVPDVAGWPADQLGRLKQTVALARVVDVPLVVTHLPFRWYAVTGRWHAFHPRSFKVPVPFPRREPYHRFLQNGLAAFEAQTGVTVAVENMPAIRFLGLKLGLYAFNRLEALYELPNVTLDTTHLGTWGIDPLAVYERLRGRVAHVHLSNFDGREHRSPPDGDLPLAALLQRLARDGYSGAVSVESGPDALDAADEARCLAALKRALSFCRRHYQMI